LNIESNFSLFTLFLPTPYYLHFQIKFSRKRAGRLKKQESAAAAAVEKTEAEVAAGERKRVGAAVLGQKKIKKERRRRRRRRRKKSAQEALASAPNPEAPPGLVSINIIISLFFRFINM
jgi:hypothetical protein